MNEIQAVKTAKIEEVKKNSKKGFTLVELVVVIAILAILAAIAIPVVSGTIKTSQKSTANTNAQTIENALKEAQAMVESNDSTYGYSSTTTISQVATKKAITSAFDAITISGDTYQPYWTESKVIFIDPSSKKDVDGKTHTMTAASTWALTSVTSGSTTINSSTTISTLK